MNGGADLGMQCRLLGDPYVRIAEGIYATSPHYRWKVKELADELRETYRRKARDSFATPLYPLLGPPVFVDSELVDAVAIAFMEADTQRPQGRSERPSRT